MDNNGNIEVERVSGVYAPTGETVRFKRDWGGHHFTDAEVADLLAGKSISFDAVSKSGKSYTAHGKLLEGEYNGHKFWGFQLGSGDELPAGFLGHDFTDDERRGLEAGEIVHVEGLLSKRTGKAFGADLMFVDRTDGNGKELKMSFPKN